MTQVIIRESTNQTSPTCSKSLYDADFLLWTEEMEQRKQIKRELKFSPSLVRFWDEFFNEALVDALRNEDSYKSINFPDSWQFSCDIEAMLNVNFWE